MSEGCRRVKRLSIVIVTHDSEEHIYACVRSLLAVCDLPRGDVELIVVDNASRAADAMATALTALWGDDLLFIRNNRNGGYGQGNNLGIRAATAPYVLVVNPDVRLCDPIFVRAIALMERRSHIALLGLQQWASPTRRSYHSFYPTWCVNGYVRPLLAALSNRTDCYLPSWCAIQGSCFFLRREMFLAIGGYDESNFMYGEEDDLHYRLCHTYGTACVAYCRHLRYIHLAAQRQPSLVYEKALFAAHCALYAKKGISVNTVRRHFLQTNRLLLIKARWTGATQARYTMLRAFRHYLLSLHDEG